MDKYVNCGDTQLNLDELDDFLRKMQPLIYGDDERRGPLKSVMGGSTWQKIYENGLEEKINRDGSVVLDYPHSDWRLQSKRSGQEQIARTITVWFKGRVCYVAHFFGTFFSSISSSSESVRKHLKDAMCRAERESLPLCGPARYLDTGAKLHFVDYHDGDIRLFEGNCSILADPGAITVAFEGRYHGGLII